jgi:mitogen-activated protein kinase kinase
MKTCKSPFIISFFGARFSDGDIVLLMEYMDLGSLDFIYKKLGSIEQVIVPYIMVSVLRGLDYLWSERKIVHRGIF